MSSSWLRLHWAWEYLGAEEMCWGPVAGSRTKESGRFEGSKLLDQGLGNGSGWWSVRA